ncbi:kinesin-like protein KIF12 [Drosophila guanche]|uniref:Kinesin-like protein n=1 Tax=Drosophila guanche TaxID=7266 RepID=A0A3B0J5X1_DROGU|nr:kinesin-like protein KIF12 [Drosophila guanche]SPP75263.1 blast:Kinesin-like protein KIF12 [Drosophila guanche]
MVRRASSVPHLNSSGGSSADSASTSGNRRARGAAAGSRGRKAPTPTSTSTSTSMSNQRGSSGSSSSMPRSRSLTNGMRRLSPQKGTGSGGVGGSSRNTPYFLRSRENEIGSADTLEIVASKSTGSEECSTPEDNINVVVRVRPLNEKEKRDRHGSTLTFPGNGQVIIEGNDVGQKRSHNRDSVRVFTYNVVFEPGATQDDILDYSGIKRIIEMGIEGFSCTAFCYGQTGSGKTHTLTGPPDLFVGKPNPKDPRHGLIFRAFVYLFQLIKNRKDVNYVLKASFMEIYNERVIDLLNPGSARKPLAVRWSKKSGGFFVENLFTVDCEELDDLLAVLEEGMRNRAVGSHAMNDHSSRSHTILTVHILSDQQTDGGVFLSKHGKINFVDLAGSELTKKTMSEGKTLEEANNINKSLMVLGYCISSLSDAKKRSGHIPYRDSQLTKLLADSLAGNGVTLMIACVSPAHYNHAETLNTLRYASRAKRIRTKPVIMMDPREALILSLKRDIHALQMENDHLKAALNLHHQAASSGPGTDNLLDMQLERLSSGGGAPVPVPKVDLERLPELDGSELAELVKLYMAENESLRQENNHLFTVRETILRDQEIVCRENERLLKKLEDVNKVCVRSPLIPARSAISPTTGKETPGTEIWTNPELNGAAVLPLEQRMSENADRRTDTAQKRIDQKRIARNILIMANAFTKPDPDLAKKLNTDPENVPAQKQATDYMPDMLT